MKIIIVLNIPPQPDNKFIYIVPNQISTIENNSCKELHITCIDYIAESLPFMAECFKKLRKNGIITIIGLDVLEIAKGIVTGRLTIDDINNLLYKGKQSIDTITRVKMFLTSQHATIEDIRINNITYYIKAIKND